MTETFKPGELVRFYDENLAMILRKAKIGDEMLLKDGGKWVSKIYNGLNIGKCWLLLLSNGKFGVYHQCFFYRINNND